MRKLVLMLGLMFAGSYVFAKGADITDNREVETVSISSSVWTAIPALTSIDDRRIAIMIDMDTATTGYMYLIFSSSAVPTASTSVGFKYQESDAPWLLPINKDVYLFGINPNAGSGKNVYIQQLRGNF